jgi:excisionase family DNA binding protein
MAPESSAYWSIAQAAAYIGISVPSMYRLCQDPSFPVLRLPGGTIRVNKNRLMVWLAEREQGRRSRHHHQISSQVQVAGNSPTCTSGGPGCAE